MPDKIKATVTVDYEQFQKILRDKKAAEDEVDALRDVAPSELYKKMDVLISSVFEQLGMAARSEDKQTFIIRMLKDICKHDGEDFGRLFPEFAEEG